MKSKKTFLEIIRSLPEAARRFLAILLVLVAAAALFVSWGKLTSSRLIAISPAGTVAPDFIAPPPQEFSQTLSPTAGIIDTLKSIKEMWK